MPPKNFCPRCRQPMRGRGTGYCLDPACRKALKDNMSKQLSPKKGEEQGDGPPCASSTPNCRKRPAAWTPDTDDPREPAVAPVPPPSTDDFHVHKNLKMATSHEALKKEPSTPAKRSNPTCVAPSFTAPRHKASYQSGQHAGDEAESALAISVEQGPSPLEASATASSSVNTDILVALGPPIRITSSHVQRASPPCHDGRAYRHG